MYAIEIFQNDQPTGVVTIKQDKTIDIIKLASYQFATIFKVRERAEKMAAKIPNAKVVPFFGGIVTSTKRVVAPPQSKINGSRPYRSI